MLGCNKSGCFVLPVATHKFDFCSNLVIFVLKRSIRRYVVQEQCCRNSWVDVFDSTVRGYIP